MLLHPGHVKVLDIQHTLGLEQILVVSGALLRLTGGVTKFAIEAG